MRPKSQSRPARIGSLVLLGALLLAAGAAPAVDLQAPSIADSKQQLDRLATLLVDSTMDRRDRDTISRWMKEAGRQLSAAESTVAKNPRSSDRHARKARRFLDRAERLVKEEGEAL